MELDKEHTNHFLYVGAVNIAQSGQVVGTVDVWKCSLCQAIDVFARGPHILSSPGIIGFRKLDSDQRWAIVVCARSMDWRVLPVRRNQTIECYCEEPGDENLMLDDEFTLKTALGTFARHHKLYFVESFLNRTIDVRRND